MGPERRGRTGGARWGTVRLRVTLLATAAVAAVLLTSSIGLVSLQRGLLTHGIDETLRQRGDNVGAVIAARPDGDPLPGEGDQEDSFLQVLDPTGRVVASTSNVTGMRAAAAPSEGSSVIRTVPELEIGTGPFRVLAQPLPGSSETLVAGKNLDDVEESVRILTISLAVSVPLVVALLALLVWWLTGRVLRPVEAIRAEVASMQGHQLDRRVPVPGGQDEISRLAETMNGMLDRVEHANERQRVFVADASHELRGPLTRLRSELEVALAHPDGVDPTALRESLRNGVVDLQQLVDDLLFLARSDAGSVGGPSEAVDLDDLVLLEARRLRDRGRVQVDTSGLSAARVLGDAHQLTRAICNLAGNAERHARGVVTFETREHDGRSEIVVADDGPGIPEEHRSVVFRRFARLDHARSRDAGGAGLGLAIVHDIVSRHAGTVTVGAAPGGGARFVMEFPTTD